ncbi:MAG: GNAT family N-acetyltransferase [Deltaproteobacteria bacterium]|nr:GNAT family N-acetyltransferase [Deltaproteobacteria bacterium]
MDDTLMIRRATSADEAALGRMGAALMRVHYDFDRQRFLAPGKNAEAGYGHFLLSQLNSQDSILFVAELQGKVIGYVYAGIEPLSWKELRDRAGFIHDVFVESGARGRGIATRLVNAAAEWLGAAGVPRIMLWTAEPNAPAQRLFQRLGFRPTMVEMTREVSAR